MKGQDDSVDLISISEIKERVSGDLKWEEGTNWDSEEKEE